ncbi:MAG: hypothetical protein ACOC9Y_06130, partial [Chloroflexota bacterium]
DPRRSGAGLLEDATGLQRTIATILISCGLLNFLVGMLFFREIQQMGDVVILGIAGSLMLGAGGGFILAGWRVLSGLRR